MKNTLVQPSVTFRETHMSKFDSSTYLTLRGDSPALAAGQVIPAANHALGQLGNIGGAHLGKAADLAHGYVMPTEGVT